MADTAIMLLEEFEAAIEWQADHAARNGAEATARVIRALGAVRASDTRLGKRMAAWTGLTLKDALPLRVAGGLHHLVLTHKDMRLEAVYSGRLTDPSAIDALVLDIVRAHDDALVGWLDGPPQTNEAGRSASIMAGLLWLATRIAPRFELLEIGASAGVNTMLDRYFFRLGTIEAGPAASIMRIEPEWRGEGGPPAPAPGFEIVSVKGCDVAPIDLADPSAALRLKAYVWPDVPERMARIDAAIALAREHAPALVRQDAGEFIAQNLASAQAPGTTRAVFHSVMWQYLPGETQAAISAAIEEAGATATPERPVAWVSLETDPATFRHELALRYWDGKAAHGTRHLLAAAHPHGAWVEWFEPA